MFELRRTTDDGVPLLVFAQSMANCGVHTNASQFFISLRQLEFLDEKVVAFGRVISGMSVVQQMNSMETQNERPVAVCTIAGCGSYAPWLSASDDASAETQATLQNMDTRRPKTKTALLLTVFSELDSAAEASVQKAELLSALRSCESLRSNFKLHAKQFPAYFEHVDADRNGKISREEFCKHGLLLLSAPGGA